MSYREEKKWWGKPRGEKEREINYNKMSTLGQPQQPPRLQQQQRQQQQQQQPSEGEVLCQCGNSAVLRQVQKDNQNKGKWFYTCASGRCRFFRVSYNYTHNIYP